MQLQQRLPNYIKEKSLKKRRRVFLAREQSLTRIANREKVKIRPNESFDVGLRKFKRACEKAGIIPEVRKREFYEKPTSVLKRKKAAAVKREQKNQRKNRLGRPPRF